MDWEDFNIEEYEYDKRTILIVRNQENYYGAFFKYNKNHLLKFIIKNNLYDYSLEIFNPVKISLDELSSKIIHLHTSSNKFNTVENKTTLSKLKEEYNVLVYGIDVTQKELINNFEYYNDLCLEKN
jgi:hypothetical protein